MSTEKRSYELRARAESQRETRERIVAAAAELHEELGVARTTVAAIARRAGVQRLTVYNHFAELGDLLPACSAHYAAAHPFPDLRGALGHEDPGLRVEAALLDLYGWYSETEPMTEKLYSDRTAVPELDRFMRSGPDVALEALADTLVQGFRARGRRSERLGALVALALDFATWRRLRSRGLDDEAAAALMARTVAAA